MRRSFMALAGSGLLLATAGCASMNLGPTAFTANGDIAKAEKRHASDPFNENLRKAYLALAKTERSEADWRDAGFFAQQAVAASEDKTPEPWPLSRWQLPPDHVQQFRGGRADLMQALNGGGRQKAPVYAAMAQADFECWAQEQEENFQIEEINDCWKRYKDALAKVNEALRPAPAAVSTTMKPIPEPPAGDYLVFFDFDKSAIRPDSARILDRVARASHELHARVVVVIGYADRAGTTTYNQALSERRARAVRAYLQAHGVPASEIQTSGRGESDPRVPTPDGVREQENRRVEIHIQQ